MSAPEPDFTAEAFASFLAHAEPDRAATMAAFRPITGGYSRRTAVAEVDWSEGLSERFVLRGDPPLGEGVFVSDRDQEWRVLQALYASGRVALPRPRWFDSTGEFFGTKTMVVDHFAGRSLQDVMRAADDLTGPTELFVDTIAGVHATPLDPLADVLARPRSYDDYIDGVLDSYRVLDRELSDTSPALRYVSARLAAHRPPPVPFVLVHGDCQPPNVLVSESGADRVVIDWEFARIGDPREDLGYYTQIPMAPNVYHRDPAGFLARYRERTGLTEEQVNPDTVEYFLVIGMAQLLGQILRALDAVAGGQSRGVMATYLINAVTHQYRLYFDVCQRIPR